jgi:hypothetical protein
MKIWPKCGHLPVFEPWHSSQITDEFPSLKLLCPTSLHTHTHTECLHNASLTWCCSPIKLSSPTTWACKHSLAQNCHQWMAYVRVCVQIIQYLSLEHYKLSSYLYSLQEQTIFYCVLPRKKFNIELRRRSTVKFEHFLSCFIEVWHI